MSTFMCHDECQRLCNAGLIEVGLSYYGLTESEIKYCSDNKKNCAKAHILSHEAEKICQKVYPSSQTNDESDACRHFIWAILLRNDLGQDDAELILNAHEDNPVNPEAEKAMDLANNRAGLLAGAKIKGGSAENLLKAFKEHLDGNKLIVLRPRQKGK